MLEQLNRAELGRFEFPRLYVDFVSGRLPASINAPAAFGAANARAFAPYEKVDRRAFWNDVLSYNERLGASELSLDSIRALAGGEAAVVLTGQQPGLFGGPLYTLYKVLTAVSLCEHLSRDGTGRVVPVLWNASDDGDFEEISTASLFDGELSRKVFSISGDAHERGMMVGWVAAEAWKEPLKTLLQMVGNLPHGTWTGGLIEEATSVAADLGEAFSALFLKMTSALGVVVVDARLSSVSEHTKFVLEAYLENARYVEEEALATLDALRDAGYEEPVSPHTAEVCVFVKDGKKRRKVSRGELARIQELWQEGRTGLVPNVLLGPIARDELLGAVASVLGPSEIGYTFVTSAVCRVLGFRQTPVFPRMSMTLVPRELSVLAKQREDGLEELITSFDRVADRHLRKEIPEDLERELEQLSAQIRSALDRTAELATSSGRSTEDIATSARRKIEFELKRTKDAFLSLYRRRALAQKPLLRQGREFLNPKGTLQERVFCSLAPMVYLGQQFIEEAHEVARTHVKDCLDSRVRHYATVASIP